MQGEAAREYATGLFPSNTVAGNPSRFLYDYHFYGAELSGRRCAMEIRPYGSNQAPIPAGEVTLLHSRDVSLCTAREFGYQLSSGSLVSSFSDSSALFKVRFEATCLPDSNHPAHNSHVYKARLARVQLLGPAGQRWQDAFK